MSVTSKTDPPLAKAEPISKGGSASVIMYLKGGKKCCSTADRRDEWEYVKEAALQMPRSVKEREEVLQVPEQQFPCSLWWRPQWGRLSPCSPWKSVVEQISTCIPWRTPRQSRWMHPKKAMTQWGADTGAGFLAGFVTLWETNARAVCSWSTAPHGRDPHRNSSWRTATCGKYPRWRSSGRIVSHGREPMLEQGKIVRRKEQQRHVMNWLQPLFPIDLCLSGAGGGEHGRGGRNVF